jgi:ABC-type nitrate/sulfonate/bicarbonate transport system substrate-binding protein
MHVSMKRRDVLRQTSVGIGTGAVIGIAGCAGNSDDEPAESEDMADSSGDGSDTSSDGDNSAEMEEEETDPTEINYLIPEGQLDIPMLLGGAEANTFTEAGVDFKPEVTGYGRYARSLTSGEQVIGNVNQDIAITAWEQGDEVTMFGPNLAQFNLMFAQPGSGIESPADFTEDTTIGVPPWASGTSLLTRTMIADEFGIDIREETDSSEVDVSAMYQLFTEQEEFDVMLQFTGFSVAGVADEIGDVIFNPLEYWEERTGNRPFVTYFAARSDWFEDNREVAANFMEGWGSTRKHFNENLDDIMDRFGLLAGLETDAQVDVVRELFSEGRMTATPDSWDEEFIDNQWELFELMEELGFIEQGPPRDSAAVAYDDL